MTADAIKLCVFTASRSDYGLMRWVAKDIGSDPAFSMELVVAGSHFSSRLGSTVDEIRGDGHRAPVEIRAGVVGDEPTAFAAASAEIVTQLTSFLQQSRPDAMLALGDRWELLAAATACMLTRTPIVHFAGGEKTEGALDDSVRHAVTKLSHLHFVANEVYAARVRQLGEEDWRICVSGHPGNDNFFRLPLATHDELSRDLGLDLAKPMALVTFHCPTRSAGPVDAQVAAVIEALRAARGHHQLQYVITAPAPDPGAAEIEAALRRFAESEPDSIYVPSLGSRRYLALMKTVRLMIGNSSSAFHEAPLANLMAVNIGDRQQGRLHPGNVITVEPTAEAILSGIEIALTQGGVRDFRSGYGSQSPSATALAFLKKTFNERSRAELLQKHFCDRMPVSPQAQVMS